MVAAKYEGLLPANIKLDPIKSEVPIFSIASAKIFNEIQPVPKIKSLDRSIKDLGGLMTEMEESKDKEATWKKIGIVALTVGIMAVCVVAIATTILLGAPAMPLFIWVPLLALNIVGTIIEAGCCSIFIGDTFFSVSRTQKKISAKSEQIGSDHVKLQTYFNVNYKDLKKKLDSKLEETNLQLETLALVAVKTTEQERSNHTRIKQDAAEKSLQLEQALVELENLHNFYQVT